MTIDEAIIKAIPVNQKCAIEEAYNKDRRMMLKKRIDEYVSEQLENQFNARIINNQNNSGMVSSRN